MHSRKGKNHCPIIPRNPPLDWHDRQTDNDHSDNRAKGHDERKPEPFPYPWDLNEKIGPLDLFGCRAPCDVVREEVCKEGYGQMNAEPAEEE
jgi:hypothetical protein